MRCLARHRNIAALRAVPCGNPMPPPQLPRDAPVVNVLHPLVVRLAVLVWSKPYVALVDGFDGLVGQRLNPDEPLLRKPRLNDDAGALAQADRQRVVLHIDQKSEVAQVLDDLFARSIPVHLVIWRAGKQDVRRLVEDGKVGKPMPLPDGKVVRIVGWRYLHRSGSELRLRPVVSEYGDLAIRSAIDAAQRQLHHLADERLVALVLWVDCYGYVAQHRLRPGRRDNNRARAIGQRIAYVVDLSDALFVFHFKIADRRLDGGIPIHNVCATIYQALLPQA